MASEQSSQILQCITSGAGVPAGEGLALAVAVFAFVGAGMWICQRFGRSAAPAPATRHTGAPALAPAAL